MRILRFILKKEFLQIFRDKAVLRMIIMMPIIQLIILPLAADFEVKNINIAIVDNDNSSYYQKLITKVTASNYFRISGKFTDYNSAYEQIETNKTDLILEIPHDFEKNLNRENSQTLLVSVNAINGIKAGLGANYLQKIILLYNQDIRFERTVIERYTQAQSIEVTSSFWYNVYCSYKKFMVPGILVLLVTIISSQLCALNIVKEKEIGTIEQINVTPIKKHIFIIGKLLPFLIIAIAIFSFGLFVIARLVYGIIPLGSLLVLYSYLIVYLIGMLGFGLLISTYSQTQQQAMSLAFFFTIIFIMMCGLFTPIDSMPHWAQIISKFNPVSYFIEVIRMVILKGSGFADIKINFLISGIFAVFFNSWAIWNYKKQG